MTRVSHRQMTHPMIPARPCKAINLTLYRQVGALSASLRFQRPLVKVT